MTESEPVFAVKELTVSYRGARQPALDGIDFSLFPGQVHGVVGESGSGKSTLGLFTLGLLPRSSSFSAASLHVAGRDMADAKQTDWVEIRKKEGSMVFQEPSLALDPTMTVGKQIEEALIKADWPSHDRKHRVLEILERVHIPDPERRVSLYPHQFSGGQRQRVCIAMALAPKPSFMIADEPTSALDVTVQQEILDLFEEIRRKTNIGIIFITHDLAVVSRVADYITVLYRGHTIQQGTVHDVLSVNPAPYTKALLEAVPSIHDQAKSRFAVTHYTEGGCSDDS